MHDHQNKGFGIQILHLVLSFDANLIFFDHFILI